MSIFEQAMKMETDGREYYLEHAEKQQNTALKAILLELADDELRHYNMFKAMRDGAPAEYRTDEKTKIISSIKTVFEQMRAENPDLSIPAEAKAIWEHALEVEKRSEQFYRDKTADISDEKQIAILNTIADEEHKHWLTIENVIQFLDQPKRWLEDAEWSNLEDY
ncbi:MAG: ferritin family protein [Candidatus Zixiibacteriota bacterium]|nr:MAG: ferritin family protein [candidate division Zixibacteria bacterium]